MRTIDERIIRKKMSKHNMIPSQKHSYALDWLSYTVPTTIGVSSSMLIDDINELSDGVVYDYAWKGYNRHMITSIGAKVMFNTERPEMRIFVEIPGSSLAKYRERGGKSRDILLYALVNGANITRLDFAADTLEETASPSDIWEAIGTERLKYKGRKNRQTIRNKDTDAVEVALGSRNSQRYMRIYDKAKEQGIMDTSWTRLELEIKKPRANKVALEMVEQGVVPVGKAECLDFLKTAIEWVNDLLSGSEGVELGVVGRKEGDEDYFLEKIVIPYLRTHLAGGKRKNIREVYQISKKAMEYITKMF